MTISQPSESSPQEQVWKLLFSLSRERTKRKSRISLKASQKQRQHSRLKSVQAWQTKSPTKPSPTSFDLLDKAQNGDCTRHKRGTLRKNRPTSLCPRRNGWRWHMVPNSILSSSQITFCPFFLFLWGSFFSCDTRSLQICQEQNRNCEHFCFL